jgi:drug/metabolite transporter (DMT)-like permease
MSSARSSAPTIGSADWGLLVLLSVLWGGAFFLVGVAVGSLPPLTIVAGRLVGAAIVLHLVMRIAGERFSFAPNVLAAFLIMGVLNNAVPFTLFSWGQQHIASALAAIFNATTPLFTALLAHAVTSDEKLSLGRGLGVVVGFLGVVVMVGPRVLEGVDVSVLASLACLGAALSYAFAGIFGRRFRRMGLTPLATATGQVTASSALMLPLALVVDTPWRLPAVPIEAIAAIGGLALLSTAAGYLLFFRLLGSIGATGASLVTFLVPVSAILLGTAILGERLAPEHLAGMALIGGGLALIDGRPSRFLAATLGIGRKGEARR